MTLSEEHTVTALIRARQSLDPVCQQRCSYEQMESLTCLYASLDMLIDRTELTPKEREIIRGHMRGYAADEISELCGVSRQAVSKMLHNAARKLVRQNERDWRTWAMQRYGLTPDCVRRRHGA